MVDHQKCDNLPTIQILIFTKYTLRQYYKKVKPKSERGENILDILDSNYNFSNRCPLCGEADCAQFIGYYHRPAINEKGRFYKDFPVARFLCNRQSAKGAHRTFSLLHYHLIPYHKYSIPFLIKVMESRHIDQMTLQVLRDYIIEFTATGPVGSDYECIEISPSSILSLEPLIEEAINKIMTGQYYQKVRQQWMWQKTFGSDNEPIGIKGFLEFCREFECLKTLPSIRGPTALSYDFYITGGAYACNSYFLFGTPSYIR